MTPPPASRALTSPLSGRPIVLVVSDPRVAQVGAERLRGAKRRLDGPFFHWSGKAGRGDCLIVIASPGGAAAWYAAVELLCRRCEPSLLLGITMAHWVDSQPLPNAFCALSVVSCEFPDNFSIENECPPKPWIHYQVAPDLSRRLAEAWGDLPNRIPSTGAKKKTIALCGLGCLNPSVMEIPSVPPRLLGEWGVQAMDRESEGLARAAQIHQIPWGIIGKCVPIAGDASLHPPRELFRHGESEDALGTFMEECVMLIDRTDGFPA